MLKKNQIKDHNSEDFFFNQDIEYNDEGLRSPWVCEVTKKIKEN